MKPFLNTLSKYKLPLLFVFAFFIRLIHLDQSLWLDEATTAMTVKTYSFWEIITTFSPHDFHPPLYYLLMDLWTTVFGYSEISLRMPSVIFSLLAGWFVYLAVLRMRNEPCLPAGRKFEMRNGAFWSAAFFLLNPLIVYYSQEARMYAMVTFFIAASFYFLVKVMSDELRVSSGRNVFLMTLFLVLSFYTFYASLFYIAAVFGFLLFIKKWKILLWSLGIWILAIIPMLPLLYTQYSGSKIVLEQVTNWSLVLGNVSLKNLLLIPQKFTSGRISFEPKMLYYALSGGWMMVVGGVVALRVIPDLIWNVSLKNTGSQVKPGMTRMLLYFLLFPLILGTMFSFIAPLLQYFRFQYLIVFMSILVSYSLSSLPHFSLRWVPPSGIPSRSKWVTSGRVSFFVCIVFLFWSLLYLLNPAFHREDWKSLAAPLKSEQKPVYMIMSSSDPIRYYAPEVEVRDLRSAGIDSLTSLGMTEHNIIVIPYTADIHGVDYALQLQLGGYLFHETNTEREVYYESWHIDK